MLKTGDFYIQGSVKGKNAFNVAVWAPFVIRFQDLPGGSVNVYYVEVDDQVLLNKSRASGV